MKPTMEILARIKENSSKNSEEVFTRLYRYLLRQDIWFEAYTNLYANSGAATNGVDNDTADGFSKEKIDKIIASLADETYKPKPARRTYIKKANGKMRPLGIPTFTDKLVQEVLRMVMEAVYEPVFLNCSHGFRPKRSCHTALSTLKKEFTGAKWFVEGDIKGCFDNIDHAVLVGFINQKIKDARLIKLIYRFLKAGFVENWQYNNTYSGTPQGGIISPLLANIYLHELDKFVMTLKSEFDKPNETVRTKEYNRLFTQRVKLKKLIDCADGEEKQNLLKQYKQVRAEMMKTPYTPQDDKKIKYIRYADDFLIAVKGNREDCVEIKRKLAEFISGTLKMELSDEKTLITHSSEKARFLGYDVSIRRNSSIKPHGKGRPTQRTLNNKVELLIPKDKISKFLFSKGIVRQKKCDEMFPISRVPLRNSTDLEIITIFNAELRGICNYYSLASNFSDLNYFNYLMEYSCLKTLATKHKTRITKIKEKFKDGKGSWAIPYETKAGKKLMYFAKYTNCKSANATDTVTKAAVTIGYNRNTFDKRLNADICELCGKTGAGKYEIHHIHKVKDLKGKELWERAMISKKRKTLVVCHQCHQNIHHPK
jgi:group II intron reverse transcriptase/maturase